MIERSLAERALNAFGDPWETAQKSNAFLPLVAGCGCYRKPGPGMDWRLSEAQQDFIRTLAPKFTWEGCAVLLETDPPFQSATDYFSALRLREHVADFKAANPSLKFIGYQQLTEWQVGQVGFAEIAAHGEWFVRRAGSSKEWLTTTASTMVEAAAAAPPARILDITHPGYRDFVTTRLAAAIPYYRMDGVLIDNVLTLPRIAPSEMPPEKRDQWPAAWRALLELLKAKVAPGQFVFVNVARDATGFALSLLSAVDGLMLEDAFGPVKGDLALRVALQKPVLDAARAQGKWIIATANTKVDGSTYENAVAARERRLARYYLAAFHVFNEGQLLFHFNSPTPSLDQYGGQAFYGDWCVNVGGAKSPAGQAIAGKPGVYKREFNRATVLLNSTIATTNVTLDGGTPIRLEAKTGLIVPAA